MKIIEIIALANGAHRNQTYHGTLPDGWAVIPDDVPIPSTFPFLGSLEVEEKTYTREVTVQKEVIKTREIVESYKEVTKTREVEEFIEVPKSRVVPKYDEEGNLIFDEDGNLVIVTEEYTEVERIVTTEEYTDLEPVMGTEEYTEIEFVVEEQEYTIMTVVSMTEGTLPATPVEVIADEVRAERDRLLAETDWTQVLDAPISTECREAFRVYRQALRDITEQEGFPENVVYPVKPKVIKATPDPVDTAVAVLVGGEE